MTDQTTLNHATSLVVSGEGPPLVLVPGMDGTGRLFYTQIPRLDRHFRVATAALRDDATSMHTLVEDLSRLIAEMTPGGEPAIVIGESFGGALAMSLALERPDMVRALVVLNSFPRFLPQGRLRLAHVALSLMPWGAMGLVRRATAFRMHSPHTHRGEIKYFLQQTRATTRTGYLNRLKILRDYDIRERLPEIGVPVLFLAADRDHLVPSVEQARWMVQRVPGAALRVLQGHGHVCLIAPDVDLGALLQEWQTLHGGPPLVPGSDK